MAGVAAVQKATGRSAGFRLTAAAAALLVGVGVLLVGVMVARAAMPKGPEVPIPPPPASPLTPAAPATTPPPGGAGLFAPPPEPMAVVAPPATRPTWPPIPEVTLQEMYHHELGFAYRPADAPRLYQAHQLIEEYFEASRSADRKAIVAKLEATGLDANLLGRITRLRMHWPALQGGAIFYVNERVGPHNVRYFFAVPKTYDRAIACPLVLKLPAANAFLTEPRPTADDVIKIYRTWLEQELAAHPDAVTLMPLLNLDELYGPSYTGMNSVIQPMLHVAGRVNIDPARVYLIGHSMAAHAAWNLGLHYPTYFAAFNALAGGASQDWQRLRLTNMRNVLPVAWHDVDDQVIPVDTSRSIVRALRAQKLDVEYEETKGVGHAPTDAIVARLYDKMRARVRPLYPTEVTIQSNRPDTIFNRVDWLQVYQEVTTGPEHRVLFRRGSGNMVVYENTFTAQASRKHNRIELTLDNVGTFRVYLNDEMVDFREPVAVVVNKKTRFEALVKPSIDEMLKDQVFLGRGWRYFTGVVDIDIVPPATRPSTTRPSTTRAMTLPRPATAPTTRKGTITIGPSND